MIKQENISIRDAHWMALALDLAGKAQALGEVPVGAVIVDHVQQVALGKGFNQAISRKDPTAHAEVLALRQAATQRDNYRIEDATLYVTLEPCAMCAGAIVHARIERVVIAAPEPRAGAAGSVFNLLDNPNLNHRCQICFGALADESSEMLKQFFKAKR